MRILAAPADEALRRARQYGADVPEAYLRIARTVTSANGRLEVRGRGRRDAVLTADRAERVIESLKEPRTEERSVPMTVTGTLIRTDRKEREFRLVLDRTMLPELVDKRKHVIDGATRRRRDIRAILVPQHRGGAVAGVSAGPFVGPASPTDESPAPVELSAF